jgi:hypothetical protein
VGVVWCTCVSHVYGKGSICILGSRCRHSDRQDSPVTRQFACVGVGFAKVLFSQPHRCVVFVNVFSTLSHVCFPF